jgi:hypothetical protein
VPRFAPSTALGTAVISEARVFHFGAVDLFFRT